MTILRGTHLHFLSLLGVILNIPPPPTPTPREGGEGIGVKCKALDSVLDPDLDPDLDSGVFWIRIRIRIQGLKKRSKMLNNHDIILLFSDFYNILSFN